MKHLRFLLPLLLLALPLTANAAWNIRQGDEGGTYWVDTDDADEAHVTEGRVFLYMEDITVASTGYVAVPIKGEIVNAYISTYGEISSASQETFRLYLGHGNVSTTGTIPPSAWTEVSNAVSGITLNASAATGTIVKNANEYTTAHAVTEAAVIGVHSPGSSASASSAAVPAMITIIINPK